jgi:hypothetical protein
MDMIIVLSILAGWILLSFSVSLLSGAVMGRQKGGALKENSFFLSMNEEPEFRGKDRTRSSWSSAALLNATDNFAKVLKTFTTEMSVEKTAQSSLIETSMATRFRYLLWTQYHSSRNRTSEFIGDKPSNAKWATSGSFCRNESSLPGARFVLSVSCR